MKLRSPKPPVCFMSKVPMAFAALMILFVFAAKAQVNLVPNPSFENASGCKAGTGIYTTNNATGQGYIISWNRPVSHTGKPYNFTTCATSATYNVPVNKVGSQTAHTGTSYLGVQTYKTGSNPDRQYVQTMLTTPLVAGKTYEFSMYVSLADKSEYATNNIGMYVSQTKIQGVGNKKNLAYVPQVKSTNVITDINGWTLVSGIFMATGGEQYLTIGNFNDDVTTTKTIVSAGSGYGNNRAFYYIDDIRLAEVALPPVAAFTTNPDPATVGIGTVVNFTDQSLNTPTGWVWTITPSTGWGWAGGGPNTKNSGAVFFTVGTYSVTLKAINAQGNNTSAPKTVTVTIPPPVANFTTFPTSGARLTSTGLAVTFTSTSTNSPTSLSWDIDNNGSADGTVSPFTYTFPVSAAGNHNNKLTATNAGGSNSITSAYNLLMPNPVANFTANGSTAAITGAAPFAVTLNNTTNSYGYANTYVWSISPATGFSYVGGTNANSQNPQLSFTTAGTYSVTLTANTTDGGTGTITKNGFITVTQNLLPVANFTPLSTTATGTATVAFNSSSSTGSPTAYLWTITPMTGVTYTVGNSASANPTVKFDNAGMTAVNYTISLKVTNAYGDNTKTQVNCVVVNPIPPATYYSRVNGDWNSNATWSTTSHTGAPATNYPKNNDIVYIKHKITIPATRNEFCGNLTAYPASTSSLDVYGGLTVKADMTVKNSAPGVGGNFPLTIDSSGTLDVEDSFVLTLDAGTFDMILGRSSDDPEDCDPDWRIEEDGSFTAENFNVSLTGVAGNVTFWTVASTSSISTDGGNSIFFQNNSTGKLTFQADWGSSIDFSSNDTVLIDHIAGGDITFQTNHDGSTISFPELVVNQKSGIVDFDLNDGGVVDISGDFRCNIIPVSSGNTSATVGINLGSFYQVGEGDFSCIWREWLSAMSIGNDFIINQNYGGNVAITLNGYTENDGAHAGPAFDIGNDLIIDHKTTGKAITFTVTNASAITVYNSTKLKNTSTGGIVFNLSNEATADLSDLDFQTGLSTINLNGSSSLDVYNLNYQTAGSAINVKDDATLNIYRNITRVAGLTDIIKPTINGTVRYTGLGVSQVVAKTGADINYLNLELNNPTGLSLEGNVNVPNSLILDRAKVNLNNYELTLGTSISSNGSLVRKNATTQIVDSIIFVPVPEYNYLCSYAPLNCINGVWHNKVTYFHLEPTDGNGWFYGAGKFTRWMPNTLVTLKSDSALFPMGNANGPNRLLNIGKTAASGSGGKISVTHNDIAGDANVNINDGGTAIKFLTNSNWNVSTTITNTTVRFDMRLQGKDLGFTAGLDKIRIAKATSVVGTHADATGDMANPRGNRKTLTAAQLTGVFYLGSTSTSGTKSFHLEEETTEVEIAEEGIVINNFYPNPVVSEAFLNINNTTESTQVEIQVMDLTGRVVFSGNQTLEVGENNISINAAELNTGTYLLRIISEKGNAVKRFVKAE